MNCNHDKETLGDQELGCEECLDKDLSDHLYDLEVDK